MLHWESRSGIFEYANPLEELKRNDFNRHYYKSLRFNCDFVGNGDSMSFVIKIMSRAWQNMNFVKKNLFIV